MPNYGSSMPVLQRPEGDLWFEARGSVESPRALVINGSNSTLDDVGPLLDIIGRAVHVVSFDHRGMGRSKPSTGAYSMIDVARDAADVITEMGWQSCAVIGISFGGMVAQHLAVERPDLVTRLVLVCTSSGGDGGASYPLHELALLDTHERAERLVRLTDTRFTPEWLEAHPGDKFLVAPRSVDESPSRALATSLQMSARMGHDAWPRLSEITCPTMVASGRFDGIAPPENGVRMAGRIPNAVFREFEGGHAFFIQDRSALPAILDFAGSGP